MARFTALRIVLLVVLLSSFSTPWPLQAIPQTEIELTEDDIDRWMKELSNWGRWGPEDQLGAVNLITPDKQKQAAGLVREGISISLARPLNKEKSLDNPIPFEHVMIRNGGTPRYLRQVVDGKRRCHGGNRWGWRCKTLGD